MVDELQAYGVRAEREVQGLEHERRLILARSGATAILLPRQAGSRGHSLAKTSTVRMFGTGYRSSMFTPSASGAKP